MHCKRRGKRTSFYTKKVGKVDIHHASFNGIVLSLFSTIDCFITKIENDQFVMQTNVQDNMDYIGGE